MAPSAASASPQPSGGDDSISAIASKAPADVVKPPRDIATIVERVAGYVARNGPVFEERIRNKDGANPKMSFLVPTDPYNAFYVWRLNEIKSGRGTDISAGREDGSGAAVAQQIPEKNRGPPEPPAFRFSARMPNISAQDLDVVKLTALFVAKQGRVFMTTLSQREAGNYQFDFLRPQHSLYQFFSRLVDQYAELLDVRGADDNAGKAEAERLAELKATANDKYRLLDRSKQRAEWVKYQERQKAAKEEEAEAEKIAYAQIDWHDFSVAETVVFDEQDAQAELPPPPSLNDLQSASLEQKAQMSLQPTSRRIEEAMPTADMDMQYPPTNGANGYNAPQHIPSPANNLPPYPPPQAYSPMPPPSISPPQASPFAPPLEHNRLSQQAPAPTATRAPNPNAAPMNIRSEAPAARARRTNVPMSLCPQCGQRIPSDQLTEHMRIELLDPRWKDQRNKSESRNATTNLSTADVANNLKRLASQRTDVFDGATGELIDDGERERRKRAARGYDGVIPGMVGHGPVGKGAGEGRVGGFAAAAAAAGLAGAGGSHAQSSQGMSLEEQIRHIRERAQQGGGGGGGGGGGA